jgi:UTP--glucose-1-phosphate uridylyltransferase
MTSVTLMRRAVTPAGLLGTRFLPATKAEPKAMLPVVDKPMIQYIVEECLASGIEDVIVVTAGGKSAIEEHSFDLKRVLEERGYVRQAEIVRSIGNLVGLKLRSQ